MLPHVALLLAIPIATAKPVPPKDQPALRYAIPFAIPAGKSKLTLRGVKVDTATEVKADGGVAVKLLSKKKSAPPNNFPADKMGDSEAEVELELPKDFAADAVTFTVVTPGGTTEPLRVFTAKGATAEKEPNDGFDKAQELTLPAVIDGTFGREKDADVFKFAGKKGQKVKVAVTAAAAGSPADPILAIYDANRQVIRIVDDTDGKPDPAAEFTLPADGVYFLSVQEANDLGGGGFAYRLRVE